MVKIYIKTELGTEKRCTRCGDYYPLDTDFFYRNGTWRGKAQWTSHCKACFTETYRGEK